MHQSVMQLRLTINRTASSLSTSGGSASQFGDQITTRLGQALEASTESNLLDGALRNNTQEMAARNPDLFVKRVC